MPVPSVQDHSSKSVVTERGEAVGFIFIYFVCFCLCRALPDMKYWLFTRDVRDPNVFWEGVPDFTQICSLPLSDQIPAQPGRQESLI